MFDFSKPIADLSTRVVSDEMRRAFDEATKARVVTGLLDRFNAGQLATHPYPSTEFARCMAYGCEQRRVIYASMRRLQVDFAAWKAGKRWATTVRLIEDCQAFVVLVASLCSPAGVELDLGSTNEKYPLRVLSAAVSH